MDKFSRENIDRLVKLPTKSVIKKIHSLMGPIIDFSPLIGSLLLLILYVIFELPNFVAIFIFIGLITQLIFSYFIFFRFNHVKVNKYTINMGLKKPISFVFVSDFHVGHDYSSTSSKRLNKVINMINSLNQELVLLGGDFLTHKIEPELLEQFSKINAKYRFAVYGNHDADYLEENIQYNTPHEFLNAFSKSGIDMLVNQNQTVNLDGIDICVAGIPDLYSKTFNIKTAFDGSKENSLKILLSHNPDVIDFVDEADNIDLILSGHNHSGQIFLPIIGAVLPMPTKRKWLTQGIFQINNKTKLFLSQGVGYSGSRLRINTDPEICLITLN